MRGLLVKDLRLLKNQRQYFMSLLVIALVFTVVGENLYFVISYCTLAIAFFSASTVSYDEHNNGLFYLFTMPISRRGYAVEKYLFALLVGGVAWSLATLVTGICTWIQASETNMAEWLIGAAAQFLALEAMAMILLPVQLKFGEERSRIATLIISFGMFAVVMLAAKIAKTAKLHMNFGWIENVGAVGWGIICVVAFIAVMLISMAVSIHVMEHKEF